MSEGPHHQNGATDQTERYSSNVQPYEINHVSDLGELSLGGLNFHMFMLNTWLIP